jgi:hypothetical protein
VCERLPFVFSGRHPSENTPEWNSQGSPHQFAQLYIIDNANAQAAARFAALGQGNVDLDRHTLQELQQMLVGSNVYVQRFV